MANRRDKLNQSNPLGIKRIPSQHEMLSEATHDDGPEPIELVNIFEILPDPQQPRRAIPWSILADWDGDTSTIKSHVFNPWFNAYGHEVGLEYNEVKAIIETVIWGKPSDRDENHKPGPFESGLFKIVDLAASIRDKGLINPITIFPIKGTDLFRIETGERRWLAYHLLSTVEETGWFRIPARKIEAPNIWKQAYENNTRDNLTAIAKARQFALLLMETLKPTFQFQPFDVFDNEQDFYAQVADGSTYGIPRNNGEKLVAAVGVQNTRQLRDLRRLLKLPYEIWHVADERGWREGRLRQLLEESKGDDAALMQRFIEELEYDNIADDDNVPIGTAQVVGKDSVPTGTADNAKSETIGHARKQVKARAKNAILPREIESLIKDITKRSKSTLRLKHVEDTEMNRKKYAADDVMADLADSMREAARELDKYLGRR